MAPQQLLDQLRRRPFEPFRVVQTDGEAYAIRHPEMLMVGLSAAVIGLSSDPVQDLFERTVILDLRHIIRIEPLPAATGKNGA